MADLAVDPRTARGPRLRDGEQQGNSSSRRWNRSSGARTPTLRAYPRADPDRVGMDMHILVPPPGPAFFLMHAWVWKPNPAGMFADWNPEVSCT